MVSAGCVRYWMSLKILDLSVETAPYGQGCRTRYYLRISIASVSSYVCFIELLLSVSMSIGESGNSLGGAAAPRS